jgi:repressor LexA
MPERLTKRQQQIYDFIASAIGNHGMPPTIREIGKRFGIVSTNGVRATLSALAKKGYITRRPKLSRGIELAEFVPRPGLTAGITQVPIIGRVAAGRPILAVENVEATLAVDESFVPSRGVFALRVRGDSMHDAGIFDGDYVLARRQHTADSGDVVVAILGEEATVKRYRREGSYIELWPENPNYDPIRIHRDDENIQIAGRVVALLRKI